ncbi:MAG: DMT family transporter [Anaerolineae bacterium]|nr:DMT family transporter [Anaerolineae bacterium]
MTGRFSPSLPHPAPSFSQSHDHRKRLRADLTLFVVAIIWGSAFVAQRAGNEQVGPFTFNAARFLIGSLFLLPLLVWQWFRGKRPSSPSPSSILRSPQPVRGNSPKGADRANPHPSTARPSSPKSSSGRLPGLPEKGNLWRSGVLLGALLFGGASLQQLGLVTTTAGKGGFITGLYVVLVPLLLALFWRERVRWNNWAGAGLAVAGLFLLSISLREKLHLNPGDVWVLLGACLWALHVIAVGKIAPGKDPIRLAAAQYVVCGLLCATAAPVLEWGTWGGMLKAAPSILYAGVLSTGLAYTGQVVAQRHAPPADAAIIMSLESVFAALSGWLVLSETLTGQQLLGCALMFVGMLLAQAASFVHAKNTARSTTL